MLQFLCDTCSAPKGVDEVWILGLAAEAVGVTAARREVTLLSGWDRDRAVHPLAVHFCSVECKDRYMQALFGPDTREEFVEEDTIVTEDVDPGDVVKTTTTKRPSRTRVVRTRTRTKPSITKKASGRETRKSSVKRSSGKKRGA